MIPRTKPVFPTPHSDVNEILSVLLSNVEKILAEQLVGVYLHGSLASGSFDKYSDIDVVFVTTKDVSKETFSALRAVHAEMASSDSPWAVQLEVTYIPQDSLRHSDPSGIRYPHLDRGRGEVLHWAQAESDWNIYRYVVRERGIVVTGPDPRTLIAPVSPSDLRNAVASGIPRWFSPILSDPSELNKRGLQSFYVLSICRMVYTLKHGEVLSKPAAAQWGMKHLNPRWKPLIERALTGRQNPDVDSDSIDIQETLDMMRDTLEQVKPTPYPEVNELLKALLRNVKNILGDQFTGMYLYGSLSSGDFDPETSDMDFLVVTNDTLPAAKVSALESMHREAWATSLKRALELEGAYIPRDLIRRHDPAGPVCPTVNEGKFYVDQPGSDWIIQRHVVREVGVIVEGPDPKTLIDPVGPDEIRGAVLGILHEWWFPMLADSSWLREHGNKYHAFAVITMCRVLHALEHGTVVSKPKAVQWARAKLGDPWVSLIDRAVTASRQETTDAFLAETLALIQFVKDQTRRLEDKSASTEINTDEQVK